ncbi:calcium/sodium antiporter [Desulfatiferula olefinivorans]
MIWDGFLLILGLLLLTAGAESLVRGSASLSIRMGLTPLVIGLTIVAFGTSTPELLVSLIASHDGQGDIALGNVIGSNIFNIGVILGITALICPIAVNISVIRMDGPIMPAVSLIATLFFIFGGIGRLEGLLLVAGLIVYTVFTVFMAGKDKAAATDLNIDQALPGKTKALTLDLAFIAGGLVLLVSGSRLLVLSAVAMARSFEVSEAVIGLTIVAAGTSMPELATSLVAALRRQPDIAVGNVIGSNIFNILGILGLSSLIKPIVPVSILPRDLWIMNGFALLLLPILRTDLTLKRWEGGLLIGCFAAYLWMLWP